MNRVFIACCCFLLLSAEKCHQNESNRVEIQLTQTESYCGGAEPPEELLTELKTPRTYNGKPVYVLDDFKRCVDSLVDYTGNHLTSLPNGHYTVHLVPALADLTSITNEDEQCLVAFKQRILSIFQITGDTSIKVNLHFGCNPCYPPPP